MAVISLQDQNPRHNYLLLLSRIVKHNNINVAFAFDEAYAAHGATAILSLLLNSNEKDEICIYIIDTGLSDDSKNRLSSIVSGYAALHFLNVPSTFFDGFPTSRHAASTYARLALGQLLPNVKQVIYLDSDIVVLDSLLELANIDISDYVVAAAPDAMSFFQGEALEYWKSIKLPEEATYFSAGVLLINLDNYRLEGTLEKIRRWTIDNSEKMLHSDQTALNAVLWDRVKLVNLRWNLQTPIVAPVVYGWGCTLEMHNAVNNPAIIHFTTNQKPWIKRYKVHFSDKYWKYRNQLNWCQQTTYTNFSDLTFRSLAEFYHIRNLLRMFVRKTLRRIPKPRDEQGALSDERSSKP